jgi:pimeloyl-ACP methyl ester carboxylesterase
MLIKNIVLVHGAFADGTSWSKIIPLLEAEGYKVVAVQNWGCVENGSAASLLVSHVPYHFDTGGREPDLQERKMVRDAPSSRLADCFPDSEETSRSFWGARMLALLVSIQ